MFATILLLLWGITSLTSAQEQANMLQTCPDWIYRTGIARVWGGICYSLYKRNKNWESAVEFCEDNKGQLVKVNNEDLNQFFHEVNWRHFWIGAKRSEKWYWSDGNPVKYIDWNVPTLDEAAAWITRSEICASWSSTGIFGSWIKYTCKCSKEMYYVCEHTAVQYNNLSTDLARTTPVYSGGTALNASSSNWNQISSKENHSEVGKKRECHFNRFIGPNGSVNIWLRSEPIETVNARSSLQCADRCLKKISFVCNRFNFHRKKGLCRLYDIPDLSTGEMAVIDSWTLWEALCIK